VLRGYFLSLDLAELPWIKSRAKIQVDQGQVAVYFQKRSNTGHIGHLAASLAL